MHDNVAVQVGNNNIQHIHEAAGNDVGLVIKYESEKIALDRDNRFYLEITNRTSAPKRLVIAVEGVRDTVAKVVPDNAVELTGRAMVERVLTLRCTAIDPMAGSIPLRVVVIDADTDRVRLQSDQVRITVPPRPQLTSELAPPEQVSSAGRYATVVRLANMGNTELRGTLQALDVPEGNPDCLGAGHVHLGDSRFDLSPGGRTEIPVELGFPEQRWADCTWMVLVSADVEDHEGIGGAVNSGREITQFGLWFDLRRHLAGLAQRFTKWSVQYEQIRRGWLVGSGFLVLVAGLLVGQSIAPTSEAPVAVPHSSSPGPTIESSIVTPTVTGLPYTKMPCEAGTSIVFLKPLTAEDTLAHGKWFLEIESARLQSLAKSTPILQKHKVQASRRDEVCPVVLDIYNPDKKFTTFVWVGPVPAAEATALCASLGKPITYDCLPKPTG